MGNLREEIEKERRELSSRIEQDDSEKFRLIEEFDAIVQSDDFFKSIGLIKIYQSVERSKALYGIKAGKERRVFEIKVVDDHHYTEYGETYLHRDLTVRQNFEGNVLFYPSSIHNTVHTRITTYFYEPVKAARHAAKVIGDEKNWSEVCLTWYQIQEMKRYKSDYPELPYVLKYTERSWPAIDRIVIFIVLLFIVGLTLLNYGRF